MINSKETLKRMIGGFVMSQDHINERLRRELENAQSGGLPQEHVLCIKAEMHGGPCPCGCGGDWVAVDVKNSFAAFTYYVPPTTKPRGGGPCVYPKWPRCSDVIWREITADVRLVCSCGWNRLDPEKKEVKPKVRLD